MALINKLKAIADAIRDMTGKTEEMKLDVMPEEIRNIRTAKEPYVEETYDKDENLIEAKLSTGFTKVRTLLFKGCTELKKISIPEGVKIIDNTSFYQCSKLEEIQFPKSLEKLEYYSFQYCELLKTVEIPINTYWIGGGVFANCTGLNEVTIKSVKNIRIQSTSFENCTNLTVINVPWSEGAVVNAPWGAVNATINYDYVEE